MNCATCAAVTPSGVSISTRTSWFEACDDGNEVDEDACINCRWAICGDGCCVRMYRQGARI